jgi:hypothetical protein
MRYTIRTVKAFLQAIRFAYKAFKAYDPWNFDILLLNVIKEICLEAHKGLSKDTRHVGAEKRAKTALICSELASRALHDHPPMTKSAQDLDKLYEKLPEVEQNKLLPYTDEIEHGELIECRPMETRAAILHNEGVIRAMRARRDLDVYYRDYLFTLLKKHHGYWWT